MGNNSKIEWTHHTFNPWWGCERVSTGCAKCYAESFAKRTGHKVWGGQAPRRFFGEAHWNEPRKWNEDARKAGVRARVFCASMADVFEDRADLVEPRAQLWRLILETPHLDWLLLTKRPENLPRMLPWMAVTPHEPWPNVWLGTTAEDQKRANERIPKLLKVPAAIHFASVEPLLEQFNLKLGLWDRQSEIRSAIRAGASPEHAEWMIGHPLDWVIVGGESGPGARECEVAWIRHVVSQGQQNGCPVFVKQLGARPVIPNDTFEQWPAFRCREQGDLETRPRNYLPTHQGESVEIVLGDPKGGDMEEWPLDLRVREFPREAVRA